MLGIKIIITLATVLYTQHLVIRLFGSLGKGDKNITVLWIVLLITTTIGVVAGVELGGIVCSLLQRI